MDDTRQALRALHSLVTRTWAEANSTERTGSLSSRLLDVFLRTWDLGFTAFGGPPVHFQIIYARFVQGQGGSKWVDEQTYQELFAICQGTPGPGSTKMLFCITLLHAGFVPALLVFTLWSFPGALAMYGLSLGVQNIGETLPSIVYAVLSGLNASTVGIIALAAVQLAEKAIKDKLTRVLVIFGACAGVCYSALWYFPVLMIIGGLTSLSWTGHLESRIKRYRTNRRTRASPEGVSEQVGQSESHPVEETSSHVNLPQRRNNASSAPKSTSPSGPAQELPEEHTSRNHNIRLPAGALIVSVFLASLITVLLLRGLLRPLPLGFSLFGNMYLAGSIIFGGGPVVIPLLRSYVVDPGWVSSRDFLIGLAIIQAFPGPNFNFAVYLGALSLQKSRYPTILGSLVAFVGIFLPGIWLTVGIQGFWHVMRTKQWVLHILRGINATAVGLVFTAVYRLWQIGYLTPQVSTGQSLALDPWWVVVTTITYAASAWFKVPPALAIVSGAVLGLCWYGTVGT